MRSIPVSGSFQGAAGEDAHGFAEETPTYPIDDVDITLSGWCNTAEVSDGLDTPRTRWPTARRHHARGEAAMHARSKSDLLSAKGRKAFMRDLRLAGISKSRSYRVTKKLLRLVDRPESIGTYIGTKGGRRTYALRGTADGGRIYVYKGAGGAEIVAKK